MVVMQLAKPQCPRSGVCRAVVWDAIARTQLAVVSVASGRICSLLALHGSDLWIGLAGGRIAVVDGAIHDAAPDDPIHFRLLKEWKYVPP